MTNSVNPKANAAIGVERGVDRRHQTHWPSDQQRDCGDQQRARKERYGAKRSRASHLVGAQCDLGAPAEPEEELLGRDELEEARGLENQRRQDSDRHEHGDCRRRE